MESLWKKKCEKNGNPYGNDGKHDGKNGRL
jgi:hypothetical protein